MESLRVSVAPRASSGPDGVPGSGPALPPPEVSGAVLARATMRRRASSFTLAAGLLPEALRDDVQLLYATFRALDDLVDEGAPDAGARVAAVEAWARGTVHAATPETATFAAVWARRPFGRDAVGDFCAGMRDDLAGVSPLTERDADRYCYRVAGTVGRVMAELLGSRHPREARACAVWLGMAMQRTNILRDIDEDLAAGRVYVARESIDAAGGSLEPGRRAELVRGQIARADALYDDGRLGIPLLDHGRGAITLAAGLYREILRQIEREGLGARPGRAVVPPSRRMAVTLRLIAAGR